MNIQR